MIQPKNILYVEDNPESCDLISFVFQKAGFQVTTCGLAQEGIRLARTNKFDAIILDLWLDGIDGIDICRAIRTFDAETPIIFYTGESRPQKKRAAMDAGAQDYLIKPEGFACLVATVTDLIVQSTEAARQPVKETVNQGFLVSEIYP